MKEKKKKCNKCNIEKPVASFSKRNKSKDGLRSQCKVCEAVYRNLNKENIKLKSKEYYIKNKEEIRVKKKKYCALNKEDKRVYDKKYRNINKAKIKKRRNNNKDKNNLHQKNRKTVDIQYKTSCNLRDRLYKAVKGSQKSGSAVKDLGCTISEFKLHMESKFYPNKETGETMSWENHSLHGWHIDHIFPLSSFDLTDRNQLLKACHYTNMQPLWAKENLMKGSNL